MILLRNLAFARNGRFLVDNASLQLHPGWKIGLIGANGSGKSSFLALLRGELHAEQGDLEIPAVWSVAHVAQDTPALPDAALEFALDGDEELRQVERELAQLEQAEHVDGHRLAELHARYADIDGYSARARAAELLHGLGFSDADFARAVAEFSGGWRVRLNLARALMCRSDLLLLDEPTNHLDLDAVLWLESWLRSYQGTLIMISHDRDFLDSVCSHTLALADQQLRLYSGGYSQYERQRAAQLANQQAMFEKQQRERTHLESYIERFRAKATKARQAQSRIKALARMEEISAAHVDTPFSFRFADPGHMPDPLLLVEQARLGYRSNEDETTILDRIMLTLRPGERIAFLGRNGAGKSTLIKCLAGELLPLSGRRIEGKGLSIGYFAQHQLELLRPDESPLQHITRRDPSAREQDLRDYLGGFDFRGPMVDAPCGRFSGGEKARLVLALLIRAKPNLLLLDEPTNHLDLEMREALNLALQEYEGGVVLVSHDRHLLRTTADALYLVADGKVQPFDGDLDDYANWLAEQRTAEKAQALQSGDPGREERKEARKLAAADRQALLVKRRPLLKESEKLEQQIARWQVQRSELEAQLADPVLYEKNDGALIQKLNQEQAAVAEKIDTAEMRWLELQEQLEALPMPD
ncbi:MAG TPA: ATP-binding cassette domain-containing protein [Rhodocyclaceae bacterium]|nr:ATP-binding cassette domain-containing protein [Rhodocyclaceae bacterium]